MALSQRQHRVLAEMGIPVWERRYQNVPAEMPSIEDASVDELVTEDLEPAAPALQGACVVVIPRLPLPEAEQSLLTAMLRTIALLPEQVDMLDAPSFLRLSSESLQNKATLFLGCAEQNSSGFSLHSDSLTAMLTEPRRKATAWQALKQLALHIR